MQVHNYCFAEVFEKLINILYLTLLCLFYSANGKVLTFLYFNSVTITVYMYAGHTMYVR